MLERKECATGALSERSAAVWLNVKLVVVGIVATVATKPQVPPL
jgi:hypothetical protein